MMKNPKKESIYTILTVLGVVVLVISTFWYLSPTLTVSPRQINLTQPSRSGNTANAYKLEKFRTEKEFKDYLAKSANPLFGSSLVLPSVGVKRMETLNGAGLKQAVPATAPEDLSVIDRFSQTNVQVQGVDEPDILKSDGKELFFSSPQRLYQPMPVRIMEDTEPQSKIAPLESMPPIRSYAGTLAIKAFPPAGLKVDGTIDKSGDLLLVDNILVVFSGNKIIGYNVAAPANPSEKWTLDLKDNNQIVTARLFRNNIYVVAKKNIDTYHPCPLGILSGPKGDLTIPCQNIYHPIMAALVDVTYTAMVVNPDSGAVTKTVSYLGSSSSSATYMSKNSLYSTYYYPGDDVEFFYNFFSENKDLFGNEIIGRLGKLRTYELSPTTKTTELYAILEQYMGSLGGDERLKQQNELTNGLNSYGQAHKRELDGTGIIKIDLNSFNVTANGSVPGRLLNQFSLDEYNDNLRVATTVGGSFFGGGAGSNTENANDVYVLNKSLSVIGKVTDLGLTERIYSTRFVEDKAFVVTFRQTDPFYVLDLSDPRNPKMSGELKIPGFSSYLHPISNDLILGVGQENGKVKLSLFDVSNPSNPIERDKYNIDDYWSEVQSTHHAFQIDKKFSVFFLPGGKGGYIFSYSGGKIELTKAISNITARRALYINNYFYVVGDNKIVVLNEANWEKVNELDLQ